jgi:hypothetical protein
MPVWSWFVPIAERWDLGDLLDAERVEHVLGVSDSSGVCSRKSIARRRAAVQIAMTFLIGP